MLSSVYRNSNAMKFALTIRIKSWRPLRILKGILHYNQRAISSVANLVDSFSAFLLNLVDDLQHAYHRLHLFFIIWIALCFGASTRRLITRPLKHH